MEQNKNAAQVEIFLNFMEKHEDLARDCVQRDRVHLDQLWEELAIHLNSFGPPIKEVSAWRQVWDDMKLRVMLRLAHNKVECDRTGGGHFNKYILSPTDEHIALICALYPSMDRIPNVKCFGVPINEKITTSAGTAKDQGALPKRDVSACTSDSPSASDNETSVSLNPTTSSCSRNRKRHINDNLREISKSLREMTKLKEKKLVQMKRHHLAMEKYMQAKNELNLKLLKLKQLKLGVKPPPSSSP